MRIILQYSLKLLVILLLALPAFGCNKASEETATKAKTKTEKPASEQEQIESEVREGGLKDPGGAKSLREESAQQQQEQQEQADDTNQ